MLEEKLRANAAKLYTVRYFPTDHFGDSKRSTKLLSRLDFPGHICQKGQPKDSVAAGQPGLAV